MLAPLTARAQDVGQRVRVSQEARLISSDIANFWRAIDRASGKDSVALVAAIREEYLAKATPGLSTFVMIRLADRAAAMRAISPLGWDGPRAMRASSAPPGSPERAAFDSVVRPLLNEIAAVALAKTYLARRKYYHAARPNMLSVDSSRAIKDTVQAALLRIRRLYPEATFADVYFVVGRLATGGTASAGSLLIGTEMYSRDALTPVDELNSWERAVTSTLTELPTIVVHEFVHTLQGKRSRGSTLLSAALNEGSAEFITELVTGKRLTNPAYAYGDAREAELWSEFEAAMDSSDVSAWLFQGERSVGRPADLGYWMGYRITKAYYDRAADKSAAVREILTFSDPKAFLRASGYKGAGQ
jgi:Predicted Zn-dependent protease (DUF2268)